MCGGLYERMRQNMMDKMQLPPVEVQIEEKKRALSAQKPVELVCRAGGSRPPANITWFIGSQPLKGTKEKISSEGNITTGRLIFIPTIEDRGKNISCRAENMLIPGSAITDEWKVDVHFVPQLTLKLGSKLRHSHIQEGKDVYLECAIIANPSVSEIGWRFEDKELHTNKSAGIIVSNQSLVLQSVRRSNRGRYTCTADNSEGKGESAPLYLKVQYAPICKSDQKLLYGVARHEPVKVTCEVEADPSRANFTWKFNNSVESMDVLSFASEDSISIATYIPRTEYDYGTLLCWGKNSVGTQKEPCVFTVIPAGPPDPVQNCSVSNHTEESLMIKCQEAYDGGLQQCFILETFDADHVVMLNNMTSSTPVFTVYDLTPGTSFVIVVYAYNSKGKSEPKIIRTSTLATPESLTQRDDPWPATFSPVLIVLICVAVVLILVVIAIIVIVKTRNRTENEKDNQKHGNDKSTTPLRQDTDDRREIMTTALETEDKCPDVIPGVEMSSDPMKVGDIHKPDIHGDSLPWETRLVNETNTAFSSMDYGPNNWGVHQRPLLKQVPSPSVPQLPPGPLQPLREYTSPNAPLHHMSPVGPPTKSRTGKRTYENGRNAVGARNRYTRSSSTSPRQFTFSHMWRIDNGCGHNLDTNNKRTAPEPVAEKCTKDYFEDYWASISPFMNIVIFKKDCDWWKIQVLTILNTKQIGQYVCSEQNRLNFGSRVRFRKVEAERLAFTAGVVID
ncbi:uncharacterized protein NPIL_37071 [Nephila pilipes]|uniref:Nephrin n=1 Tax=Nephila pilipes TaxID=299642 RepID=A0A8X6TWT1_NEPPI|nr:uncharacterized protein NPIL_37071 [Nephila pilipes]